MQHKIVAGLYILRIADFLCFAGTNFREFGFQTLPGFGNKFLRISFNFLSGIWRTTLAYSTRRCNIVLFVLLIYCIHCIRRRLLLKATKRLGETQSTVVRSSTGDRLVWFNHSNTFPEPIKLKFSNLNTWSKFSRIIFSGSLFLRGQIFADRWKICEIREN